MKKTYVLISTLILIALIGIGYFIYKMETRPYVFVPYESTTLSDKKSLLDQKETANTEKKIQEIEAVIADFDEEISAKDKNSTYFVLSSHQQSIGHLLDAKKTLEKALIAEVHPNMLQAYAMLLFNM